MDNLMSTKKKFFTFCFAGGVGAVIEIIFFNIFFLFLSFEYSKAFALILALSINFLINRNITFLANSGKIHKQMFKYALVYSIAICVNFTMSLIVMSLLSPGKINGNIAAVSGIISAIPISFFGSLYWVFKKSKS
jgi:putative flippase GtrA